ncbi:hypothetical protein NRB_22870 [Novosphingobium sp. 11B]
MAGSRARGGMGVIWNDGGEGWRREAHPCPSRKREGDDRVALGSLSRSREGRETWRFIA